MKTRRPGVRGLLAASAAVTVTVGLLAPPAQAGTPRQAPTRAQSAADDTLPEATSDEKYKAALVVDAGDDLNLQAKQDCDFVSALALRATGGSAVRQAADQAYRNGTASDGSSSDCTLFIREGIFEANLQDQETRRSERVERDARQAAAAAISLEATPTLLAMSNYDFVAQIVVKTANDTHVHDEAAIAVGSNDAAQLTAFITTGIFAAHRQDVIDAIDADATKNAEQKAAALWTAAKARALAVIGVVATPEMLVLDDTNFVYLISTKATAGSEVAAAATEALSTFDADKRRAFVETGIYAASKLDITKALQKQAEENRAAARAIQAKATNSLVHPALASAAATALAGSDADVSRFLRDGQHTAITQTLRSTVLGKTGWYVRGDQAGASVAAEGTGTGKALTDAVWKIVPGLGDDACHSLESVSSPGYYLREVGYAVKLVANDSSAAFKTAATWCATAGKSGSNVSLESKSKPGRFLRHWGSELWTAQNGTAYDFDRPCGFEANATWKIDNPSAPALADKGAGETCNEVTGANFRTPDYLIKAREFNGLSYGQVSGTKLVTPTAVPTLTPWSSIGEFAAGDLTGVSIIHQNCPKPTNPADCPVTQDREDDIVAIERSTGKLWMYPDIKRPGAARVQMGTGWNAMRELVVGRFCNPLARVGMGDVVAVERSTGKLWCYALNSDSGSLSGRKEIGLSGWNNMTNLVAGSFGLGQFPQQDLIGVERSTGILYIYPGKDGGISGARVKLADNWKVYSTMAAGDFNGTGDDDLLVTDSSGSKWLYAGIGGGKFAARVQIS